MEVDYKLAFWTATLGSASALGLEEHLGSFAPGKQFDAVVVACDARVYDTFMAPAADGHADGAGHARERSLADDFERYANLGDDRNVKSVYVRGRLVSGDEQTAIQAD